ncbi:Phosphoglycerate mutase family [Pseudonocardia sp. Ae168_Ps1]|uniref:histidine phosphatase family protein n=1 Tax=unclassified Pseudonocardia TaxID=2619320 RepID=UPI0001FFE32E|nr:MULTISPECIES: histidine phosphatase family protein [unclassified Pseudonocardia]ALE72762.1 histidine phosphatase [Pseudonocardia sp. EC080625-04]ALL76080.1 histidine phosphatase [Pseudonocardia sp. EC080610-09]ALL83107.1 histidine phosphatase [Pseudonocardia sp. EC080619-01]OLL73189.1 Phosphoglycerate mutase family [Pseudonocardia sp. Ae150A_Ps1]OLL79166.1 Phosphoglycerate mutase family [Pseudonocardia sp. Ae168_Ps1]
MTLRRITLLRHGQTEYNAGGRMQGHLDTRLTDEGRAQAAAAAPLLAGIPFDRIVTSDLSRAHDTATAVAGATGLPLSVDKRLRETHLGDWQGRTVAEIEADDPGAIAAWRSDPRWTPPGGESRVDVVNRSLPVVAELDAAYADDPEERSVLLVAHGGMIAGMVCGLLDLPESAWPVIGGMGNAKWSVVARRADHPRWRLSGYNIGA